MKTARTTLITLGSFIMIYSLMMLIYGNLNFGIAIVMLFGAGLVLVGIFLEAFITKKPLIILLCLAIIGTLYMTAMSVFLACVGQNDNASEDADAVIILGAGIKGERLSVQLKGRLDAAIKYCTEVNTEAYIVCSGGRGYGENITEALAMERYLISKGISEERIIKEEESVSTYTNLANTKEILDGMFEDGYSTVIVSTEYHIYRASCMASKVGLESMHLHAGINWYEAPISYWRESLAVLKYWLTGN